MTAPPRSQPDSVRALIQSAYYTEPTGSAENAWNSALEHIEERLDAITPAPARCDAQMREVLDFLNGIEGSGYGGMASFEIARMHVREALGSVQAPWQPIETAPRDGTPLLAANSRLPSHAPVVVRWLDEMSNPDTGWCDAATASGDALYYNRNYFDLWMPPPALPSSTDSREVGK